MEELRATVAELRRVLIEGEVPPEQLAEPAPEQQPVEQQPEQPQPEPQPPQITTGDDLRGFPKSRTFSFDHLKGGAA